LLVGDVLNKTIGLTCTANGHFSIISIKYHKSGVVYKLYDTDHEARPGYTDWCLHAVQVGELNFILILFCNEA
jgi:hypothetical protein